MSEDWSSEIVNMTDQQWNEHFEAIRQRQVTCKSGLTMSVQASAMHYCSPRSNTGPYSAVEIGMPSEVVPELMPYAEVVEIPTETVYSYVPVAVLREVIDNNGGMVSGELPPLKDDE